MNIKRWKKKDIGRMIAVIILDLAIIVLGLLYYFAPETGYFN